MDTFHKLSISFATSGPRDDSISYTFTSLAIYHFTVGAAFNVFQRMHDFPFQMDFPFRCRWRTVRRRLKGGIVVFIGREFNEMEI